MCQQSNPAWKMLQWLTFFKHSKTVHMIHLALCRCHQSGGCPGIRQNTNGRNHPQANVRPWPIGPVLVQAASVQCSVLCTLGIYLLVRLVQRRRFRKILMLFEEPVCILCNVRVPRAHGKTCCSKHTHHMEQHASAVQTDSAGHWFG